MNVTPPAEAAAHAQAPAPVVDTESPASPRHGSCPPVKEKYHAALASLRENTFVNDPTLSESDRICRSNIQGTWRVQQTHRSSQGYCSQIMLVWDCDRIWGSFDLGSYKGVLMVDHGPRHGFPEGDVSPVYSDFTWRGTCSSLSDVLFNRPLIMKGKIELTDIFIRGYFEGMMSVGLPDDRCDFEGVPLRGPRLVPRTVQSFIDEWNTHKEFEADESLRLPPTAGTAVILTSGEVVEMTLWSLNGWYDLKIASVSVKPPDGPQLLNLHLHYDKQQNTVWGYFNMGGLGIGYLVSRDPLSSDFAYRKPLKLEYRCRQPDKNTSFRGVAEVTLWEHCVITGRFYGMYGYVLEFKGMRKDMPGGISGLEMRFYRQG